MQGQKLFCSASVSYDTQESRAPTVERKGLLNTRKIGHRSQQARLESQFLQSSFQWQRATATVEAI